MTERSFSETVDDLLDGETIEFNGCTLTNHRANMARGPELLNAGWQPRDIPWCSPEAWTLLMSHFGEEGTDWVPLITTVRAADGATRGQLLVAASGLERLSSYVRSH